MTHPKYYSKDEENLNIWSHGLGIILSSVGLILLVNKASSQLSLISALIFGISMILLYSASTLYHSAKEDHRRMKLRILDHAAIYVLIAGTYTPFSLISLKDEVGLTLFIIIWSVAAIGIALKLFFTGKFTILSTMLYVAMGWIAIFYVRTLIANVVDTGLYLLGAGGIAYTLGAFLYSRKKLRFNHAIFHFFVLVGSVLHYLSIYYYVI